MVVVLTDTLALLCLAQPSRLTSYSHAYVSPVRTMRLYGVQTIQQAALTSDTVSAVLELRTALDDFWLPYTVAQDRCLAA